MISANKEGHYFGSPEKDINYVLYLQLKLT
jgi:hypothetical protein